MEATRVTESMRRPRASSIAINAAAIGAILLRDIKVRAGRYYTGFLMILLMPLAHLLVVLIAYRMFGRLAPQGTDQVVYFGLSVLPFVIYAYLSRQIGDLESQPDRIDPIHDEVVAFMSALDYYRDFEPLVKSTFISYSLPEFDRMFADILALQIET